MTGSGKTGLGICLLEEALLQGIPTLVIDPKGAMGNPLLTFPDLAPSDFRPWINEGEAEPARRRSREVRHHDRGRGLDLDPHSLTVCCCQGSHSKRPCDETDPKSAELDTISPRCVRI
jgi:hypothetical protein